VVGANGFVCFIAFVSAALLARAAAAQAEPTIVFIAPQRVSIDTQDALEDALGAQVSLVGARLNFRTADDATAGLEPILTRAKTLAREHAALGVMWLDAQPSGRWFLYIMDAGSDEIVVRPLSAESTSLEATIEAVAVIARSATEALMRRADLDAGPPVPVAQAPLPPADGLRLEVGYAGFTLSPRIPWLSGLAVGAAWMWRSGPYAGLSYVWYPPAVVETAAVDFSVTPYPISARGGYRFDVLDNLTVSAELAVGIELRTRETLRSIPELTDTGDSTKPVYFLGIAAAADVRLTEWLSLTARISPELVFRTRDYVTVSRIPMSTPIYLLMGPYPQRFTASLGLAIIR
jgi:hypothetical protein